MAESESEIAGNETKGARNSPMFYEVGERLRRVRP